MSKRSPSRSKPAPPAPHQKVPAEKTRDRGNSGLVSGKGSPSTPAGTTARASASIIWALVTALLLALVFVRIPRHAPTTALDPSWGSVLGFAHSRGLQFGTEIVFTYGPLGFLTIPWFSGHAVWTRMIFDAVLYYGIAAGICLVAWRLSLIWRCLLLGVFILLPANHHLGPDLPMEIGLLCWGLLCLLESGRRVGVFALSLVGLAVIAALGKITFLVTAAITVGAVACGLMMRGHRRLGFGVALGFALAWVFGWVLLGQNLFHVGAFFVNALAISGGYEQAMGLDSPAKIWRGGVVTALLALTTIILRSLRAELPKAKRPGLPRALLLVWLSALLWISYKHGFVRANADLFGCFVPMLVLALEAVPSRSPAARWLARASAVVCCLLACLVVNWKVPGVFNDRLKHNFDCFSRNVRTLLKPADYAREMSNALGSEQARAQLPKARQIVGRATVDVFGQNQSYAIFNALNYQPRPVFQSYSVYNASLMRLNERFYASKAAPEFVLFNLAPIDARFPPLEDAYVLRSLLANYTLVDGEGPFLLLKRSQLVSPQMAFLCEGVVGFGEPIVLAEHGDADLWMEITLRPTWRGRLRHFFYKSSDVLLGLWCRPSGTRVAAFRAPPPMLAAGFLASPLVLHNGSIVDLYTGNATPRPIAYSVELDPDQRGFWSDAVRYRIYRVESEIGRSAPLDLLRLKSPGSQSAAAYAPFSPTP